MNIIKYIFSVAVHLFANQIAKKTSKLILIMTITRIWNGFFLKKQKTPWKLFFITSIHLPSTAVVIHIRFAKFLIFSSVFFLVLTSSFGFDFLGS